MPMTHSNHPERAACTDDYRYSERLLTSDPGMKQERERMAKACRACALYLDCLEDVIAAGNAYEYYEVQAGIIEPLGDRPDGLQDRE
jgi:hypothetical protein